MVARGGKARGQLRRRSGQGAQQRIFGVRPSFEVLTYALVGVLAAVGVAFGLWRWLGDTSPTVDEHNALDTPAEVLPPPTSASAEDGAHTPPEPRRSDVASERAALDAPDDSRAPSEPIH
jgi:hypothetical protein